MLARRCALLSTACQTPAVQNLPAGATPLPLAHLVVQPLIDHPLVYLDDDDADDAPRHGILQYATQGLLSDAAQTANTLYEKCDKYVICRYYYYYYYYYSD